MHKDDSGAFGATGGETDITTPLLASVYRSNKAAGMSCRHNCCQRASSTGLMMVGQQYEDC